MTINCKGNLISLASPKVMGIVNLTPDSFYDGGKCNSLPKVLKQVEKMLTDGATFIDLGAHSSRPNAKHISQEEEMQRIVPIVKELVKEFPEIILSIDTFRSKIAKACINEGAAIINDISAGNMDANMMQTVGQLGVPYIMMHMQGTPQNMQKNPEYKDITKEIIQGLGKKLNELIKLGINDIIIDPGFGFGKTIEHNYELLDNLDLFSILETPMLVGISRKSFIYKKLGKNPEDVLEETTKLHEICLKKGASILRVHDVAEAKRLIINN